MSTVYRVLEANDLDAYLALERYAFQVNPDRNKLHQPQMSQLRGLFAGNQLLTQLELIPLQVRTGLGNIRAAGVGSVASDPATRRQGHVANLLRHLNDELRAEGVAFCVLYPFKRSFYGRYGWASFFERRRYSGPPASFAAFAPASGQFVAVDQSNWAELDRIYQGALRGRFGPIQRDEQWWQQRVLHDFTGQPLYAYIWRDANGVGRSYTIFALETRGQARHFVAREMVALDPEARAQLFAFIAGHEDQVSLAQFHAPTDAPVNLLFPEPLDCAVEPHFMLRLLDLPAALQAYPFPNELRGSLTLAVRDDWIAANQGCFTLEFNAGQCAVTPVATANSTDLACDIRTLTQLLTRYLRPRTAAAFGLLEVTSRPALALLETAVAGLAPFSSDFF
ncbi:MAG: GNAT family N-acetyltransferase [Oscillochloridaceae bacterium umkhey_bin13]